MAITPEQSKALEDLLPHGFLTRIFNVLIDDLIQALRLNRDVVLGTILNRTLHLEDFSKPFKGEEDDDG